VFPLLFQTAVLALLAVQAVLLLVVPLLVLVA
jgi:hypothetical protein